MRGHLNLYVVNGMYWVTAAAFLPFIGAYYASVGMTESEVGILMAVFPLSALVVQPFWAYLSDRTGKRKGILLFLCVGSAAAVMIFSTADSFWKCLGSILLYSAFSTAILPICDALVLKASLGNGGDFSRIRMAGTISYAAAVVVIGYLAKQSFSWIFPITCFCFGVFFCCCISLPKDSTRLNDSGNKTADRKNKGGRLFKTRQVLVVLLFAFLVQLGLMYHGTFLGVYLIDLGFDNGTIGVMNCISALSEVPVLLLINRLRKRFGIIHLLLLAVSLCALRLFLVSTGQIAWMMGAQVLQGPSYMVSYFSCVMYVNENVLDQKISQGQSVLTAVQSGLGAICGSLIGGFTAQRLGIQTGFVMVGLAILFVGIGIYLISRLIGRKNNL